MKNQKITEFRGTKAELIIELGTIISCTNSHVDCVIPDTEEYLSGKRDYIILLTNC